MIFCKGVEIPMTGYYRKVVLSQVRLATGAIRRLSLAKKNKKGTQKKDSAILQVQRPGRRIVSQGFDPLMIFWSIGVCVFQGSKEKKSTSEGFVGILVIFGGYVEKTRTPPPKKKQEKPRKPRKAMKNKNKKEKPRKTKKKTIWKKKLRIAYDRMPKVISA